MKLLIAIPALDEESSIGSIIERCLEARAGIIAGSSVTAVDITVVSDGSTDRTVEIAQGYADRVRVIVFERNRGYGAAITEAWRQSDADLLSFLDADGTCDPSVFAALCAELDRHDADVVLGCRLNRQSRMPLVRRIGNTLFALMLSVFSMERVRDVASGMRVVRRSSLGKLYPLPSGLHFTPAMSARALLSRDVRIREIDMSYEERAGESKLHPVRDGLRFLRVILETAFLYRPSRPLGLIGLLLFALTCVMMIQPTWFYVHERRLEEWMIYRFLVGELLSSMALLLFLASHLGRKAADIALSPDPVRAKYHGLIGWMLSRRWFWLLPLGLGVVGVTFVGQALIDFLRTGEVYEHWSRFVAMMFFLSIAFMFSVAKCVDYSLNLLADHLAYVKGGDVLLVSTPIRADEAESAGRDGGRVTAEGHRSPSTDAWEAAYERFETPQQERAKFAKRLRALEVSAWPRDLRVVEIFCGRGNGLSAWTDLGFSRLEGLDISPRLVARYQGPAAVVVADARALPFESASRDVVAVQGGLHHLRLMDDLDRVLAEVHRVLTPAGRVLVVEPWLTPFLRLVHGVAGVAAVRRAWPRLDALHTMIEHERETYEDWLARPGEILEAVRRVVEPETLRIGWGKLMLVGRRRGD